MGAHFLDWIRIGLTEVEGVEEVLVEQNDGRTQGNPSTGGISAILLAVKAVHAGDAHVT
jgi:hypothetical protein